MSKSIRSKERFLVFGSPQIEDDEVEEVLDTVRSGWLGTGPKVARFEEMVRDYKGVKYAVAVNSCTAALHLSLLTAGLRPGDEVITTPMTFCATVNAIIHSGATPVLADIDPDTMNIDPSQVERQITSKTRAILPVHFAGRPCDMDALCEIARRYNLDIIEDCAHAIETEYKGRKAGTFGRVGCLSFYVTKNVITGEGGMVLTDDEKIASQIKVLALHGMSKDAWKRFSDEGYRHYSVVAAGFKYNMMDLQAAIGIHQLKRIERCWRKRSEIWNRYNEAFAELPLTTPSSSLGSIRHAYHLYTVLIDPKVAGISRDLFLQRMTENNIGVGVHYLSIPEHPYYQERYGWNPAAFPNATAIGRKTVSLPLSPKLTSSDVSDVIEAVRAILKTG